jgi:hypothetical protein
MPNTSVTTANHIVAITTQIAMMCGTPRSLYV